MTTATMLATNLPKPTRNVRKRNLYRADARARHLARIMRDTGADFASVAEGWSHLYEAIREDLPRYRVTQAAVNDRMGGARIRNAVVWDAGRPRSRGRGRAEGWRREDRVNLRLPWAERPQGLNQAAGLFTPRASQSFALPGDVRYLALPVGAGHLPTRGAAPQVVWERMAHQIGAWMEDTGGPCLFGADWNRPAREVDRILRQYGAGLLSSAGVMGVAGRGVKVLDTGAVPAGRTSDHDRFPWARVRTTDPTVIHRLPRLQG